MACVRGWLCADLLVVCGSATVEMKYSIPFELLVGFLHRRCGEI